MSKSELIRVEGLNEAERKLILDSLSPQERKEVLLQAALERQKEGNISLGGFLETIPQGRIAYYKDCEILEWSPISGRYWLLLLKLPAPRGGTLEEIVGLNALVELREN